MPKQYWKPPKTADLGEIYIEWIERKSWSPATSDEITHPQGAKGSNPHLHIDLLKSTDK